MNWIIAMAITKWCYRRLIFSQRRVFFEELRPFFTGCKKRIAYPNAIYYIKIKDVMRAWAAANKKRSIKT